MSFRPFRAWLDQRVKWTVLDFLDHLILRGPLERFALSRLVTGSPRHEGPIHTVYVDLSVIHRNDAGTGIQRVVRSIAEHLAEVASPNVAIVPVVIERRRDGYRTLDGGKLKGVPGAVFFGLDFATDAIHRYRQELASFSRAGGELWFLLHDLLPLTHPHWFTPASRLRYRQWIRVCTTLANGILCVSESVAEDLRKLQATRFNVRTPAPVWPIRLGANLPPPLTTPQSGSGIAPEPGLLARAAIVVGTLEPRKGHVEVIDAFERLWQGGHDIPLVLIGRPGWGTDALQSRIRQHPLHGQQLFWFDNLDDSSLHRAYAQCRMVIVPSFAEGYGLPMDEALALGAPVLARDISVFQRHASHSVAYFQTGTDIESLARTILDFHGTAKRGVADPRDLSSWRDAAQQVLSLIGAAGGDLRQQ